MNSIVLYTNGNQECERARMLLEKLNTQIQEYKLNNLYNDVDLLGTVLPSVEEPI